MPIYEYKCSKCYSKFEVIQKVADPPLNKCIKCGGGVTKTISAPAIQFKGSGWYITDYAQKSEAEKDKTPQATEKKEAKKTDPPSPPKSEKQTSPSTE